MAIQLLLLILSALASELTFYFQYDEKFHLGSLRDLHLPFARSCHLYKPSGPSLSLLSSVLIPISNSIFTSQERNAPLQITTKPQCNSQITSPSSASPSAWLPSPSPSLTMLSMRYTLGSLMFSQIDLSAQITDAGEECRSPSSSPEASGIMGAPPATSLIHSPKRSGKI